MNFIYSASKQSLHRSKEKLGTLWKSFHNTHRYCKGTTEIPYSSFSTSQNTYGEKEKSARVYLYCFKVCRWQNLYPKKWRNTKQIQAWNPKNSGNTQSNCWQNQNIGLYYPKFYNMCVRLNLTNCSTTPLQSKMKPLIRNRSR